jgi:pimeloyl-ACP methyl ester carboxylesterase
MYLATQARSLPLVIDAASRGDFGPFLELALPAVDNSPPFLAEGAYQSFTCTDDVSRINVADIALLNDDSYLGDYRVEQQVRACELWPSGSYPVALDRPFEATVPALLITGERDPITPPSDAELMSRGLPNSRVVIVPHAGHLPFDGSDPECIDRVMLSFLASATVEGLDLSCIDALKPLPFIFD